MGRARETFGVLPPWHHLHRRSFATLKLRCEG